MSRVLHKLVFFSLFACHTAVTVCGPCLHELPGVGHQKSGLSSKPQASGDEAKSRLHTSDHCLVCQYIAQGQLPVERASVGNVSHVVGLETCFCPSFRPSRIVALAHPRAPPVAHS